MRSGKTFSEWFLSEPYNQLCAEIIERRAEGETFDLVDICEHLELDADEMAIAAVAHQQLDQKKGAN